MPDAKHPLPWPLLLCAALCACILLWPNGRDAGDPLPLLIGVALVALLYLYQRFRGGNPTAAGDVTAIVLSLLLLWEIATTKLNLCNPIVVPPPENVFLALFRQRGPLFTGVLSSLHLLVVGFAVAIPLGVAAGMAAGWSPRLKGCLFPIGKVVSAVPPSIYSPYLVALMPTFRSASAMVLILGLFWPTFLNTIVRVGGMERRMLDSARVLSLSRWAMLRHVLLPYLLPGVISSLHVQLSTSFLLLTLAEMLGASSGMGYFVRNNADYANYASVVAGILVVGLVITLLNKLITVLERKLIHWKY